MGVATQGYGRRFAIRLEAGKDRQRNYIPTQAQNSTDMLCFNQRKHGGNPAGMGCQSLQWATD